ncbi:WD40-repeat-containing domain protein [Amanita rubescens]|nr:WD40-repeat-containing domain protein [Amanita rubescens]KAF8343528.1 WD40-repeat-containing domain protein [Amanita rubescens]
MPYRYSPVARSHQWLWMNRPRKERNAKVKIYMLIHRPNHISRKTKMQNRRYHDPGNLNAMRSTRKAPLMSLQPALSPCFQVMRQRCGILSCAWNPKNHPTLASGSRDAVVNFWTLPDPSSSTVPSTSDPFPPVSLHHFSIKAGSADLTSLNWSPSGQLLAIGSYDSILRISKPNGELYFTDSQHNGPIFATRFSKSGHWLLTASLDGTTCLWNVSEKRLQRQYHCHTDGCLNVAWLDDWTFASCGADSQIYIIQVDGGESIKTLSGHENEINEIRCNSTGTRLASCSDDTTARVWNIENISSSADSIPGFMASDVIVLRGHSHAITTICWCPDHPPGTNQLIATSSFDGTARIWDSVTGECLKVLADHERPIFSMTFSPNGKWLATGSGDGWLHIYSVESRLKRWSWHAGANKPGVFEIDWQEHEGISRLAVALECRQVAVIDALAIPALRVGHRTLRKRKRS